MSLINELGKDQENQKFKDFTNRFVKDFEKKRKKLTSVFQQSALSNLCPQEYTFVAIEFFINNLMIKRQRIMFYILKYIQVRGNF
jgi:hypothetical protein